MIDEKNDAIRQCYPVPDIKDRILLSHDEAATMEGVFKVLANGTRLRILHALIRTPGIAVGELADSIGMEAQAVSNQLRRLLDKGIVVAQRDGNFIRYRIVDACTINLLNQGFCLAFYGTDINPATYQARGEFE